MNIWNYQTGIYVTTYKKDVDLLSAQFTPFGVAAVLAFLLSFPFFLFFIIYLLFPYYCFFFVSFIKKLILNYSPTVTHLL